jgi:ribulose-phosphate 3-epimerase
MSETAPVAAPPIQIPEFRTVNVVPSLLAADLSKIGVQLDALKAAGCKWVSVDVMDGHFVPNFSFGPDFVKLAKKRGFFVDAHLMVDNPETVVQWFVDAGADILTFHAEAVRHARISITALHSTGKLAGLAIKPGTPVDVMVNAIQMCDLALVMTVEPGFGGQAFKPEMLPKVQAVRQAIKANNIDCYLQVDGGINAANIGEAAAAGADSIVSGSSIFGAPDIGAAFKDLEARGQAAFKL